MNSNGVVLVFKNVNFLLKSTLPIAIFIVCFVLRLLFVLTHRECPVFNAFMFWWAHMDLLLSLLFLHLLLFCLDFLFVSTYLLLQRFVTLL